jgi:hypothetical protein
LDEYCKGSGQPAEIFYGYQPQVDVDIHFCFEGSSVREKLNACAKIIWKSHKIKEIFREAAKKEAIRQRNILDQRRKELQTRSKIYCGGSFVAYSPVNEYEVVMLSLKILDIIRKYVVDFEVLSYASNEGVDCIARYRSNQNSSAAECFVEYETSSRHFLDHQHPFEHIDLVICWHNNLRSEKLDRIIMAKYGASEKFVMNGVGPLYRCQIPDHNFQILALEELPELEVVGR